MDATRAARQGAQDANGRARCVVLGMDLALARSAAPRGDGALHTERRTADARSRTAHVPQASAAREARKTRARSWVPALGSARASQRAGGAVGGSSRPTAGGTCPACTGVGIDPISTPRAQSFGRAQERHAYFRATRPSQATHGPRPVP